eukprot:231803_1
MSDKTSQIPKVNPPKKQIQHSIPAIPSKSKFVAVRCPSYYVQDVRHYPLITKLQQAVQHSELLLQQAALEARNQSLTDENMELAMALNDAKQDDTFRVRN